MAQITTEELPERQAIALQQPERGERAEEARRALLEALPDATFTEPDQTGFFEVSVEADSYEAALERVWDAIAAAGADDHVLLAEHPSVPEHWRHRTAKPI